MPALQAHCQLIKHALAPLIPVPAPESNLPRSSTVSTAAESSQKTRSPVQKCLSLRLGVWQRVHSAWDERTVP